MEEDKKKKKNKKKKNKLNVLTTNDTPPVDDLVGKNHATSTSQVDAASAVDLHLDAQVHLPEVILVENSESLPLEKDLSMQKEAALLTKIEELQNEKAAHFQQEASLQEQVSLLEKEKDAHMKKEASLQEQVSLLEKEKDAHMKKEADLEKIITELQIEKELQMQKESLLEVKIRQLLTDKESWSQKEALFEEKINQLMDEAANLSLKKVCLEEKVKQMEKERDSWILQENLSKDAIVGLNGDNSSLKSQVVELEELRNCLSQENLLLKETISDLQSRNLNLERTAVSSDSFAEIRMHATENGDAAPQTEAAHALVEKLIGENAELVEKANELSVELHSKILQQEGSSTGSFARVEESFQVADSSVGPHLKVGAFEMHRTPPAFDVVDEAREKVIRSDLRAQALKNFGNNGERSDENLDANNTVVIPSSSEMVESDEIVQIPLDENERGPTELEAWNDDGKAEVPFTDAPLIGAPFRLISFVARYVSGADLVERNSVNSGGG